jgi:hypothetical protein
MRFRPLKQGLIEESLSKETAAGKTDARSWQWNSKTIKAEMIIKGMSREGQRLFQFVCYVHPYVLDK